MWQEIGYLLFITAFFVLLPIAVDVVVLWRLNHARTDCTRTPTRMVIGYVGLAANFSAIAIVWGTFYCNLWFSYYHSGAVVGGELSLDVALILALSSLIFSLMAPKDIGPLLAFAGLYVGFTMMLVIAGAGVL
jgi:hypothetical protein